MRWSRRQSWCRRERRPGGKGVRPQTRVSALHHQRMQKHRQIERLDACEIRLEPRSSRSRPPMFVPRYTPRTPGSFATRFELLDHRGRVHIGSVASTTNRSDATDARPPPQSVPQPPASFCDSSRPPNRPWARREPTAPAPLLPARSISASPFLQVDEFARQRSVRFHRRLEVEPCSGFAEFATETPPSAC